jgi:hypothetical protein
MGAFFTNVQLLVRGQDERAKKILLLKELYALAEDADLTEAAPGEEPDRSILIESGGGILSVFDEATEGQNGEVMFELASRLARALSAQAMTVTVHDSDVLLLTLVDAEGDLVDTYNSYPSLFGKVSAAEKKRVAGDPSKWVAFLREGATTKDLASTWKEEKNFCEDTLLKTLGLFGIERERATVGFRYASKSEKRTGRVYEKLEFRARVRPAHETKAEGATRLTTMGYAQKMELSCGFAAHITFSARNEGGTSKGLSVVVGGDAIARGLVELERCQIVIGPPAQGNFVAVPFQKFSTSMIASFPDAVLPAGSAAQIGFEPGMDPRKMVDAMYASNVHANIHGKGGKAGEGTLSITFIPLAHEEGAVSHEMTIATTTAPRRPLRAPAESHAHVLRPLQLDGTLFLLVMLDQPQKKAMPFVKRALASFAPHTSSEGKYELAIFKSKPDERPSTGSVKAKGFFESARFAKLCDQMVDEALVSATRGDNHVDFTSRERTFGDGFAFGTSIIPDRDKKDPELPTLGLWLDVTSRSDAEIERARAMLHAIADDAMKSEVGVQAIVARWGWAPSSLDTTAYELATDVHGQCTLRRSWATRFLRGVATGTMWLGKDLAAHVRDLDALRSCATVDTSIADVVKVTIAREEDLDRAENALAELLPSGEDYQRGIDAKYGR